MLLLTADGRNRDLLAERLAERHRVVAGEPDGEWEQFDLCIVDAATYPRVESALAARKREAQAYLPVLLLVPDRGRGGDAGWLAEELGGTVDDVLVVPAPEPEFEARVGALLRVRRQSLTLALYRRAMDEASFGITITDPTRPDNPIVYANDEFLRLTGYDREAVLGRNCRFLQGPGTDEAPVQDLREAVDAGAPATVELLNYRADGTPFWNRVRIAPVRDDEGTVTHFLGFQEDVTDRIERERELERERERFRALARSATDAILVADEGGTVVYANEAVERIFGHAPAELEGAPLTTLVPDRFQDRHEAGFRRYLETGERSRDREMLRFPGRHADGHEVPLEISFAEFEDADGPLVVGVVRDVSEREALQTELRSERDLLERVFDTSPVAITVLDTDGEIVRANETAERVLDLPRSGTTSRRYDAPGWEVIDADGEPLPAEDLPFSRVVETGAPVEDCRHGIRVDGEERWLSVNAAPLFDGDGAVEAVVTATEDITGRVERERDLERTNDLLDMTQSMASVGGWEADPADGELRWTAEVYDIYGLPADYQPELDRGFEFVHPEDEPIVREAAERAIHDGEPFDVEARITTVEDEERWLHIRGEPQGTDSEVDRLRGTVQDITERKERERELERYETIVQTTTEPVFVLDRDLRFTRVNEAMAAAAGYAREDLLGSHVSTVTDESDVPELEAAIGALRDGEREQGEAEVSVVSADGTRREYVLSMATIRENGTGTGTGHGDGHGRFEGVVAVAHEVTDLRAHQRRLSVLDRVLRHNLRNKMNVVLGHAEDLAAADDPAVAERAERILGPATDLLEVSDSARRFESAVVGDDSGTETVDVAEVVREVVAEMRREHPGVALSTSLPEEASARVHETFELAVEELVENAVLHSDRAEPSIEVSVAVGTDEIEVRVADDGPGLDEIDREALRRGGETTLSHTQGIGLWLVRWSVESAEGTVDIAANEPRGTVVTVRLPRGEG